MYERVICMKLQKWLKRVCEKTLHNPELALTYRGHGSRLRSFVLLFIVCLKSDLLQLFVGETNHLTFRLRLKNALSSQTNSQLRELFKVHLINSLDQYYNSCRKSQDHKIFILHPFTLARPQLFASHLRRVTLWEKVCDIEAWFSSLDFNCKDGQGSL